MLGKMSIIECQVVYNRIEDFMLMITNGWWQNYQSYKKT